MVAGKKNLFIVTDSLMYEVKAEDIYLVRIKKCLCSVIIQLSQNIVMIQTK